MTKDSKEAEKEIDKEKEPQEETKEGIRDDVVVVSKDRHEELLRTENFVRHIENHLKEMDIGGEVCCKICDKTITEINENVPEQAEDKEEIETPSMSDLGDLINFDCLCGEKDMGIVHDGEQTYECECGRVWKLERTTKVILVQEPQEESKGDE